MKKILLIEDNDDIRTNTAEILELASYEVVVAENGKRGVELALEHLPDLVICDIMMPVLDGYGVLHALHRNDRLKNTPFIFLTAKTERADLRKGMELGADDYITKPFSGTELLNAVDSRLKKCELLQTGLQPGMEGVQQLMGISFGDHDLAGIVADRDINTYKKKQVIYMEGHHPNRLFYVLSGKVKTAKRNDDGKELVTALYGPGEFFGYLPLLQQTVYRETAEVLEDAEIAIIPSEDFHKLVNGNLAITRSFMGLLAQNIQDKEEQLLGMAYNSLRKKVAEALVMLQKKYRKDGGPVPIDLSRENLAGIAGTATESLIRTLSDFRSEKLLEIDHGRITILDEKRLANLLN